MAHPFGRGRHVLREKRRAEAQPCFFTFLGSSMPRATHALTRAAKTALPPLLSAVVGPPLPAVGPPLLSAGPLLLSALPPLLSAGPPPPAVGPPQLPASKTPARQRRGREPERPLLVVGPLLSSAGPPLLAVGPPQLPASKTPARQRRGRSSTYGGSR